MSIMEKEQLIRGNEIEAQIAELKAHKNDMLALSQREGLYVVMKSNQNDAELLHPYLLPEFNITKFINWYIRNLDLFVSSLEEEFYNL